VRLEQGGLHMKISIMLTTILLIFPLLTNAGSSSNKEREIYSAKSHVTDIEITGAFGLHLGARYSQDFIKPTDPDSCYKDGGNYVKPSKPIDILPLYKICVDDKKVLYRFIALSAQADKETCEYHRQDLALAFKEKYGISGESWLGDHLFDSDIGSASISSCLSNRVFISNDEQGSYRFEVEYISYQLSGNYYRKLDASETANRKKRIDSYLDSL